MLDIEPSVAEHKSRTSFRDKIKDVRDRVRDTTKRVKDKVVKMRDDHYKHQMEKAQRKSNLLKARGDIDRIKLDTLKTRNGIKQARNSIKKDALSAKTDLVRSKIENKRVKSDLKREKIKSKIDVSKNKIDTINAKRELIRAKRHNKRAYADVVSKIIAGKEVTPEELSSFKGNAGKRGAFEMKSWTDKAPRKALHKLMAGLNSNNPAIRASAVEEFKTKLNAWKNKTALKVEDYRAKRDRRTKLGVEAMKGVGLAMAAKALVPDNKDDDE